MGFFSRSRLGSLTVLVAAAALALAGCSPQTAPPVETSGAVAQADPTKVYAEGVPTLEQLYASTEHAPSSSGPKLAPGKSVIFVSCGQASPGCAGPADEITSIAEKIGWNYKIIDGAFNVNDGYNTGMRQAIAAKPDAIVVHGISCQQILQPLREAQAANIPVFNIQGVDCDDPKNPGGATDPLFVDMIFNEDFASAGEFYYEWGFLQAAYVIDATEGHAQIIRTHYAGSVTGDYQQAGQDAAIAKCADCKILATIDWVPSDLSAGGPLVQKFTTELTRNPSANAVIAEYDSVATTGGISKAITDAHRESTITVVGGEGYASALQLIREKAGLTADPGQSAAWMAWGVVDTMNRYFNDSPLVAQGVGFRMVDIDHNMMPDGEDYAPPIDFKQAYLDSWGVS